MDGRGANADNAEFGAGGEADGRHACSRNDEQARRKSGG
jgi:hypothetical protein